MPDQPYDINELMHKGRYWTSPDYGEVWECDNDCPAEHLCETCNGSGLVADGLPSNGPVSCSDCGPDAALPD